ncbi:MAG: hypothetical protein ABIJ39_12000 [Chloroflexota bacterium]
MKTQYRFFFSLILISCLVVACNFPTPGGDEPSQPTETQIVATDAPVTQPAAETPVPTIVHLVMPAEVPDGYESSIRDMSSEAMANEGRAMGGENYAVNLFERPFNAETMDVYYPDLDIQTAQLKRDSEWVYVTIELAGPRDGLGLAGNYGVEVDLNVDGRGDVLIFVSAPGEDWSTDRVQVWVDENDDVGDDQSVYSDPPQAGNGYEELVFDQGIGADPDAAWGRVSPSDPSKVQIAFKRSLIDNDEYFTWGAWTDQGVFNPSWFDYNDHFSHEEAGSPIVELTAYYPLGAMAELDNTCRWGVGFTPTGTEPGVCPVPVTPTPEVSISSISGYVFNDNITRDLVYTPPTDTPFSGVAVSLHTGTCGSGGTHINTAVTNGSGWYSFSPVAPGTYCVLVPVAPMASTNQTGPQTVILGAGQARRVDVMPQSKMLLWGYVASKRNVTVRYSKV